MKRIVELPADNVRAAISDEFRGAADRERDPVEKPEAILRASGIARGTRVADIRAGDGWFVQILMPAVNRFGRVWGNNDPAGTDAATAEAWKKRLEDPSTAIVGRFDLPVSAPLLRYAHELDVLFSRYAYADAIARGVDRAQMNASAFAALKAGGRYVVVESHAAEGMAPEAAAKLCRANEELVRREVEAAGFRLLSSGKELRESADDASQPACASGASRKATDRMLLVFEKPSAAAGSKAAEPPAAPSGEKAPTPPAAKPAN